MATRRTVHVITNTASVTRFIAEKLLHVMWGPTAPVGHMMVHAVRALDAVEFARNPALFTHPPAEYHVRFDIDGEEVVVIMAVVEDMPSVLILGRKDMQHIRHYGVPPEVGGTDTIFNGTVLFGTIVQDAGSRNHDILFITDIAVNMGLRFVDNPKAPYGKRIALAQKAAVVLNALLVEQAIDVETLPDVPCGPSAYEKITKYTAPKAGLVFNHKDAVISSATPTAVWRSLFKVILVRQKNAWWLASGGRCVKVTDAFNVAVKPLPEELKLLTIDGTRVTFKIKCVAPEDNAFELTPISTFTGQLPISDIDEVQAVLTACKQKLDWKVMKQYVLGESPDTDVLM